MLQQTRVAAVLAHYSAFLLRFPDVKSLARARESSVLAAWSGLGYYRRARMLHQSARKIVSEREKKFPATAKAWRELPGIGRYTAAAIASIAFGEPSAVVDGNVERVLDRVFGKHLRGETRWQVAQELLSPQYPGDFNQAMMELGATVCLPSQPDCAACPVSAFCFTRGPLAKSGNSTRQKRRDIHYVLDLADDSVFLQQRPKTASLMPGMWELPEVPPRHGSGPSLILRHSITDTDYRVHVSRCAAPPAAAGRWVATDRATALPLTGLTRKILRAARVI